MSNQAATLRWRANNREKYLAGRRSWRKKNKKAINAAKRARWAEIKDTVNPTRRIPPEQHKPRSGNPNPGRTPAKELREAGLRMDDFLP